MVKTRKLKKKTVPVYQINIKKDIRQEKKKIKYVGRMNWATTWREKWDLMHRMDAWFAQCTSIET